MDEQSHNNSYNNDSNNNMVEFDGGDTGCGELLLDLLLFMKRQAPGALVSVRALDPGAPLEIPAWCRMTQHRLLNSEHPFYQIQVSSEKATKP